MMGLRLKCLFASAVFLAGLSGTAANATTVLTPPLTTVPINVDTLVTTFNITSVSGQYDLDVRYGIWDGLGTDQQATIYLTIDGRVVTPLLADGAYFSSPETAVFDVTSFVQDGENTLYVYGNDTSGPDSSVSSYAIGTFTPTPLPAALPLFAGGLGLIGMIARRTKRKADSALAAA
jgi:hypothetical protein